jgi:hypothetical protein
MSRTARKLLFGVGAHEGLKCGSESGRGGFAKATPAQGVAGKGALLRFAHPRGGAGNALRPPDGQVGGRDLGCNGVRTAVIVGIEQARLHRFSQPLEGESARDCDFFPRDRSRGRIQSNQGTRHRPGVSVFQWPSALCFGGEKWPVVSRNSFAFEFAEKARSKRTGTFA